MFPLFESICIEEGIPRHLPWHQRRVDKAFDVCYPESPVLELEKLIVVPESFQQGLVKCRVDYNRKDFKLAFTKYHPHTLTSFKVVYADDLDYSLKYSDRSMLEKLLEKKGSCDEIIIVKKGHISDSSFSNIVFYDGKKWETPSSPLLEGTCRSRLLDEGAIEENQIRLSDLSKYQSFKLINAMLPFDTGTEYSIDSIQVI